MRREQVFMYNASNKNSATFDFTSFAADSKNLTHAFISLFALEIVLLFAAIYFSKKSASDTNLKQDDFPKTA